MNAPSLTDAILVIPNFLSSDECQTLINYYEKKQEKAIYETSWNVKKNDYDDATFAVKTVEENTDEYNLGFNKIKEALIQWINHLEKFDSFNLKALRKNLNFPHLLRILKYETGASIHPHTDWSRLSYATCTLNLNDNYEGGMFSFFNQKYGIKLGKGDALVFPANPFYVHEVTPIISGTRYSLNTFILSEPKKIELMVNNWLKGTEYTKGFNLEQNSV